jgi:hypothetical protein
MIVVALILDAISFQLCLSAHPCSQHLSSCRNCLTDTSINAQFCRTSTGLGQCIPPGDALMSACQTFQSSNLSTLITSISQCKFCGHDLRKKKKKKKKKKIFFFFLDNKINFQALHIDLLLKNVLLIQQTIRSNATIVCLTHEWLQLVRHVGNRLVPRDRSWRLGEHFVSIAASWSIDYFRQFHSSNPSLANQCPNATVPNYCVTYQTCSACQADPNCAFCLSFSDDCFKRDSLHRQARSSDLCRQPRFKRPNIIGPAPDLDITCPNVPRRAQNSMH